MMANNLFIYYLLLSRQKISIEQKQCSTFGGKKYSQLRGASSPKMNQFNFNEVLNMKMTIIASLSIHSH